MKKICIVCYNHIVCTVFLILLTLSFNNLLLFCPTLRPLLLFFAMFFIQCLFVFEIKKSHLVMYLWQKKAKSSCECLTVGQQNNKLFLSVTYELIKTLILGYHMCNIGSNGMEQYIMIVNSLREKLILCQRNKFNMKEFKANKTSNISKGKGAARPKSGGHEFRISLLPYTD